MNKSNNILWSNYPEIMYNTKHIYNILIEKGIKERIAYFKYKSNEDFSRDIIICAIKKICENGNSTINLGYSILNPIDKSNETLGKKIAKGRAEAFKTNKFINFTNLKATNNIIISLVEQIKNEVIIEYKKKLLKK